MANAEVQRAMTALFGEVGGLGEDSRDLTVVSPYDNPRQLTALGGLVILVVLADVHLTRGLRERSWMTETVATVNAAGVDLVAVVGDLVDGRIDELGGFAAPLKDLDAPLGAYFVTGNHEFFSGADEWAAFLPTVGRRVLRNERVEVTHSGVTFDLAGIDDVTGEREGSGPDLPGALAGRDATGR